MGQPSSFRRRAAGSGDTNLWTLCFFGKEKVRTAIYIDGFNLYYGAVKDTNCKWLNPKLLCENILQPHHDVVSVVLSTARVRPIPENPDAAKRQSTYIKALTTYIPELTVVYGHFLQKNNLVVQ